MSDLGAELVRINQRRTGNYPTGHLARAAARTRRVDKILADMQVLGCDEAKLKRVARGAHYFDFFTIDGEPFDVLGTFECVERS